MEFLYPSLLWGLLLILLPIIIHLFNLRRYRIVYFSNTKFIEEVKNKTKRRSQLKNLLILLSRILFIAFIVFAFAYPYIPYDNKTISKAKSNLVTIYIDNSYSMSAKGTDGDLLNEAKRNALDIINVYDDSYRFIVLSNDFSYSDFISRPKQEAVNNIDLIDFSPTYRNISEILSRHYDILKKDNNSLLSPIYCLSDLQTNTSDISSLIPNELQQIHFIKMLASSSNNLFIDTCWLEYPYINFMNQNVLNVRIRNIGDVSYENIPLKMFINGRQEALSSFNIAQNTFVDIALPFVFKNKGINDCRLSITDYPIVFDDEMFLSFNVSETINVINIFSEKSIYINQLFAGDSLFNLIELNQSGIDYSLFKNANLIILNSLKSISTGINQEIVKYLNAGGNLIIIPSQDIDFESYKSFLSSIDMDYFTAIDTTTMHASHINYDNYLLKNVFEQVKKDIILPKTKLHYKLSGNNSLLRNDLMKLINEDILVTSYTYNAANILVFTSPVTPPYSDMAKHPLFFPIVYNAALFAVKTNDLYYLTGIDNAIPLNNINVSGDNTVRLLNIKNKNEFIPEQRNSGFQTIIYPSDQIVQQGNYHILINENPITSLAFNYNRLESDLRTINKQDIDQANDAKDLNIIWIENDYKYSSIAESIKNIDKGIVLWQICLIAALIFIVLEISLIRFLKTDGE